MLADYMGRAAVAARTHADPARVGLAVGDELANGPGWNRWVHLHDMGHAYDARDWRNITDEIVVEFLEQRRVDRGGGPDHEERIAICGCAYDCLDTDIAAAPWTILDEKL